MSSSSLSSSNYLSTTSTSNTTINSSNISGYTNYCTSCNQNSNSNEIYSSSSSKSQNNSNISSSSNSSSSSNNSSGTASPTYLLSTSSSESLQSLRAPAEVFQRPCITKTFQIMKDKIDDYRELRSKIKDDLFIKQQLSLLTPGIENSEKRFLVHEFTRSAMLLPGFNEYERFKPLIDALINEVDPNDLLGCSTALEMLADIASSKKENIQYFESIGLLQKIYDLFQMTKQHTDMGITHTACIRFFGYLSTTDSNSLEKFPVFTADVFDAIYHFDLLDPLRCKLTFETFAVMTKTIGAKKYLSNENCPYDIAKALTCLTAIIVAGSATPERKAWYLDTITTIFENVESNESSNLLKNWFIHLGEHFPRILFDCLKKSLPEVQIASLNALIALMKHQWAPNYFCSVDGFINFLLNREIHFSTIGYQLKYNLICRFIEIKPSSINDSEMEKLINYRNIGVYASQEKQEIATDEVK